jgi:uncharacterized protein (DUF427 family)
MSVRVRDLLMRELDTLRYEPLDKRIRAALGDDIVIDTTRAMLVWEPKRVVPTYAVPVEDVAAEILSEPRAETGDIDAIDAFREATMGAPQLAGRMVLDPSVPFGVRTTEGDPLVIRAGARAAAGFRARDAALGGYVIVDFDGFDAWYEEDERNVGHPRDPFHRIDIVHGSCRVRVEREGTVLAESARPYLLFEPPLPVRYYLPAEDVRTDLLRPSDTRSVCAYKGHAHYWSVEGEDDVAWSYPAPLREGAELTDRFAFFNERLDLFVDGTPLERPVTPWSPR